MYIGKLQTFVLLLPVNFQEKGVVVDDVRGWGDLRGVGN